MAGDGIKLMLVALAGAGVIRALTHAPAPEPARTPVPEAMPAPSAAVALPRSGARPPASTGPIGGGIGQLALARAPDGHFYADALVNGAAVRFLVDTGATGVVLTTDAARRAGLGSGEFSAEGRGAGGKVALRPVSLARLAIGPLVADNVPAMVAAGELPISLLGQSYLSRVGSIEISGDKMVLK